LLLEKRVSSVPESVRVIVAEEQELVRSGMCLALASRGKFDVVAQVSQGSDVMAKVEQYQPGLLLLDIDIPKVNGLNLIKSIRQRWPHVRVMVLTANQQPDVVLASLTAGATAYCMKTIGLEALCQIMLTVAQGAVWLDPSIAPVVLQALPKVTLAEALTAMEPVYKMGQRVDLLDDHLPLPIPSVVLTEREWQVLAMIVDGKSNKEIAQLLSVSTHTAKAHVCHIIQKLNVDDRTQVAVKALKEGLVEGLYDRRQG
jgi:DNA-binding NarL/FixJ family response regulator